MASSSSDTSTALKIVSIISIVCSVGAFLYGLCLTAVRSLSRAEVCDVFEMQGLPQDGEVVDSVFMLADLGLYYALFNALEVVALTLVLLSKRIGFHLYAASQLGCVGLMTMVFGFVSSLTYILWCVLWCLVYWNLIHRSEAIRKE